jgi:hypothetical protein
VVTTGVPTVVDATGATINFIPPSFFYYKNFLATNVLATVGSPLLASNFSVFFDGTLGSASLGAYFFEGCTLDITGNTQTQSLPSKFVLDKTTCVFSGTPDLVKSVVTPFCSNGDPVYNNQVACEGNSLTWDDVTSKCSNPDYQYSTKSACLAAKSIWYKAGAPVPYRIIATYHDQYFAQNTISTTINIGVYKSITNLSYTQSEKMILPVTPVNPAYLSAITPVTTTTNFAAAYSPANIIAGQTTASGIVKYVDTSKNEVGIQKLTKLAVTNIGLFTLSGANSFISGTGTCSDGASPTKIACDAALKIWTTSGKIAKIFKIDVTNGILYVENFSLHNLYFSAGNNISRGSLGATLDASIISVDDTYTFRDTNADNNSLYSVQKFTIGASTYVYETGSPIKPIVPYGIDDSIGASNGLTYSISPALPAGISFDTATGIISGTFNSDLPPTQYSISISNPVSTLPAYTIKLYSQILPSNYSLGTKQIITVTNTAFFKEGEDLHQPIAAPSTDHLQAKILKIIPPYKMAIETYGGEFLAGASLDSGSSFVTEQAKIIPDNSCVFTAYTNEADCVAGTSVWSPGPIYYNLALTLSSINGAGGYLVGQDITTTEVVVPYNVNGAGASAHISEIYTGPDFYTGAPINDVLFVQMQTQNSISVALAKTFYQGDTVKPGITITQIDSSSMDLTLFSGAGFAQGADIVSTDIVTAAKASGYTHKVNSAGLNGTVISVSDISKQAVGTPFKVTDSIANDESTPGTASTSVTAVTYDNLFVLERGKKAAIHGSLASGTVAYSIFPALPAGLSIDPLTGAITGTPTVVSARKEYIVSAINLVGAATFATAIEVRDYFQLVDKSAVTSFLLHKVGDAENSRKCRINYNDILNNSGSAKALDIRCFLDADEEALHMKDILLNVTSGAGVCQFVQYAPYYFQQYKAAQSVGTTTKYPAAATVNVGCLTSGTVPTVDLCEGYYSAGALATVTNCDEGYLSYTQITNSVVATVCTAGVPTTQKVLCGGAKSNCIAGPINKLLTTTDLQNGFRSFEYGETATGFNTTWTIKAPGVADGLRPVQKTNLLVANGTINNKCTASRADVNAWALASKSISGTVSPLGGLGTTASNPTANPYYEFDCQDAAKLTKARIRLVVRDWDTAFKVTDDIDNQTLTPSTLMNNPGTDVFSGLPFNAKFDWDDNYSTSVGAAAAVYGSCGVVGAQEYRFPGNDL